MKMRKLIASWSGALLALVALGCLGAQDAAHEHQHDSALPPAVSRAIAVIQPTQDNTATGVVTFTQMENGVHVVADVSGLKPNAKHGFHVHEFGDISSADGTAAGSHYNPQGHPHALPNGGERHAGDFGNLEADAQGKAHLEIHAEGISIAGPNNPILGRAVIVHADPDDGSQPTGNAGARIGQGVIGVAKPAP